MPAFVLSTMPSGSTRLTVASLYSLPLINLKSSGKATDANHEIKRVKIFILPVSAKNRAPDRMCLTERLCSLTKCYQGKTTRPQLDTPREQSPSCSRAEGMAEAIQ